VHARRLGLALNKLHARVYSATGGRVGGRMAGRRVLLLKTTGRKTGKSRVTPVAYVEHEDELMVVAAGGGRKQPPAWLLNLEANPRVEVTIGRRRIAAHARVLNGDEREEVWRRLCMLDQYLPALQQRAGRKLAVAALRLAAEPARTGTVAPQPQPMVGAVPTGADPASI